MNDQLDRTLADGLRRDAARISGRGPGLNDVRRRVRQRRQRNVVLGTAPAVLGAAWLVTRPTPTSIGAGDGSGGALGDATTTAVEMSGDHVSCIDADGNPVEARLVWNNGIAEIVVDGSPMPLEMEGTTTYPFESTTTYLGQQASSTFVGSPTTAVTGPDGPLRCEWIGAEDFPTPTTIAWVSNLGNDVLCIDAGGTGEIAGGCLQFATTNQVAVSATVSDHSFVMALTPEAQADAADLAAALCLPLEPRQEPFLAEAGAAADNYRVAVVLGFPFVQSTIPGGGVVATTTPAGGCDPSSRYSNVGGDTTTTSIATIQP